MEWAFVIIFVTMVTMAISIVIWSVKNGISPMPTTSKARSAIFSLLPSEIKGNIYELGSGWGTIVIPLARKFPNCKITGYETSPLPFWFSRIWLKITGLANASLIRENFFAADLSAASLIVCYLYPGAMEKLKSKFEKELKPGTLVASNTFAIQGWTSEKIIELDDLYRTKIYLYKIPKH